MTPAWAWRVRAACSSRRARRSTAASATRGPSARAASAPTACAATPRAADRTRTTASAAPKVGVPGIDSLWLDQKKADFFREYLAQSLGDHGFDVITAKQMAAVIGLERQKQLLGCADSSSSCLAELAGALGAELLL